MLPTVWHGIVVVLKFLDFIFLKRVGQIWVEEYLSVVSKKIFDFRAIHKKLTFVINI